MILADVLRLYVEQDLHAALVKLAVQVAKIFDRSVLGVDAEKVVGPVVVIAER
jgi:hypothetical protein